MREIPHELIAQRAYLIWDRGGRIPGRDRENWQQAIDELRGFYGLGRMIDEWENRHQIAITRAVRDALRQKAEDDEVAYLMHNRGGP